MTAQPHGISLRGRTRRRVKNILVYGTVGAVIGLLLAMLFSYETPTQPNITRSPPVGTYATASDTATDPATGGRAWQFTDYAADGTVVMTGFLSPDVAAAPVEMPPPHYWLLASLGVGLAAGVGREFVLRER